MLVCMCAQVPKVFAIRRFIELLSLWSHVVRSSDQAAVQWDPTVAVLIKKMKIKTVNKENFEVCGPTSSRLPTSSGRTRLRPLPPFSLLTLLNGLQPPPERDARVSSIQFSVMTSTTSAAGPSTTQPPPQKDPLVTTPPKTPQTTFFSSVFSPQISSYFIAGGVAGAASRTVVSPLERIKIIQLVLLQVRP